MSTHRAASSTRAGSPPFAPPIPVARLSNDVLASTLARLLADGAAQSKSDLARITSLARSTIDTGVRYLLDREVIRQAGLRRTAARGRAAGILELNPAYGYVLIADCELHRTLLAVFDTRQNRLAAVELSLPLTAGPEAVCDRIVAEFRRLLNPLPHDPLLMVIGLPGPIDHHRGAVVRPQYMPAWDGFPVALRVGEQLGCAVLVENDVNLRALGEARAVRDYDGPLLYVHAGIGIGAGIVLGDGRLQRGADGAAGEIGHQRVFGDDTPCACGNTGCLETLASGAALVRRIRGISPTAAVAMDDFRDFRRHLAARSAAADEGLRMASELLAEAISGLVLLINPGRVVLGGELADDHEGLLVAVRGAVYRRGGALATRRLALTGSSFTSGAAIAGGLGVGIEHALSAEMLACLAPTIRASEHPREPGCRLEPQ